MPNREWDFPYRARYEELDSSIIYNFVGRKITDRSMEVENKKTGFYEKLEQSILKEGFFNPIFAVAGWSHDIDSEVHQHFIRGNLPKHMQEDDSKILMCDRNGGSRLFFAQKYNLKVPCIISDFVERFPNSKELFGIEDIKACFKHPPRYIKFDSRGVLILIPHKIV